MIPDGLHVAGGGRRGPGGWGSSAQTRIRTVTGGAVPPWAACRRLASRKDLRNQPPGRPHHLPPTRALTTRPRANRRPRPGSALVGRGKGARRRRRRAPREGREVVTALAKPRATRPAGRGDGWAKASAAPAARRRGQRRTQESQMLTRWTRGHPPAATARPAVPPPPPSETDSRHDRHA